MNKRIGSLLIAFMVVFAMMPSMAFAGTDQETARFTVKSESSAAVVDSGICGDDLSWELDSEGALKISGTGAMYDYSDDLSAPWRDETIFKVVIEEGVTSVGAYAFANCGLKQVVIPSTVKIIKECAFIENKITELIIEEGVEEIGQWSFSGLYMDTVTIPKSAIEISSNSFSRGIDDGKQLFYYVYKGSAGEEMVILKEKPYMYVDGTPVSGTYGDNLTWTINGNTLTVDVQGKMLDFKNTSIIPWKKHYMAVKKIRVTGSPENIGKNAFYNMSCVELVELPETVTCIGESAFEYCEQLKLINLPAQLKVIGDYAFSRCESLEKIELPSSITTLGNCAFKYCDLKELLIPYNVTSLELPENYIWALVYGNHDFEKLVIMNRECKMPQEIFETDSYTVYGFDRSTAETFALENDLKFVSINATHEHTWGEAVVIREATCIKAGIEKRTCISCGEVVKTELALTEHKSSVKKAVAATCTKAGLTEGEYCYVCDKVLVAQQTVPAKGHTSGAAATCTTGQTCTVCNAELVPATGHTEVVDAAIAATTKAAGKTAGSHCAVCDEVFVAQTTIPKIKTSTIAKATYTYDGKAKKPAVTVKDANGKKLANGTDYTVKYTNAKGKVVKTANVGTYKAVITFKGNYSGTVSKTFKINPKGTTINKLTKPAKKQIKVAWKKQTAQVTGYQIKYSTKANMNGSKTVTVAKANTTTKTIKQLKAKKKYYVQIRTYKTVNGTKYYSAWSVKKSVVTK